MGLEAATFISQLNAAWPIGASDPKAQGDDHLRLLKSVLQATFPNASAAITLSGFAIPTVAADVTAPSAGVLNTALRSDARLQLSQAIVPVWSGLHTFQVAPRLSMAAPEIRFDEIDQAADEIIWRLRLNAKQFSLETVDNAISTSRSAWRVDRGVGVAITNINIGNATDNPTYNLLGTGQITANGRIQVLGDRVEVSNAAPLFRWTESDQAADETTWVVRVNAKVWALGAWTDALGVEHRILDATRGAGAAVTAIQLGNATDNPTYAFLGTGAITTGGPVRTPNGTSGAPSNSFSLETTLGWYRNGAGSMRASVNADVFEILAAASGGAKVADPAGTLTTVGYRAVPRSTTATTLAIGDVGKCVVITAAINIPISVFAAGDCLSIYNDSAGALNLTISAGTLRLAGTTTTGTRSIAPRGMCTIWFNVGGATPEAIASGPGVS